MFGLRIDVDLRKRVTLSNTKPEVVLRRRGRHLEIAYYVITPSRMATFGNLIQTSKQKLANYCDLVKIAKGRRIPIWQTFVFPNRK